MLLPVSARTQYSPIEALCVMTNTIMHIGSDTFSDTIYWLYPVIIYPVTTTQLVHTIKQMKVDFLNRKVQPEHGESVLPIFLWPWMSSSTALSLR